jgi:hypothetical protein
MPFATFVHLEDKRSNCEDKLFSGLVIYLLGLATCYQEYNIICK